MCAVVCTSQSKPSNSTSVDYERLAEAVNTANSTWVADPDVLKSSPSFLSSLKFGLSLTPQSREPNPDLQLGSEHFGDYQSNTELPEEFDLRKQYPNCTNIGHVQLQSNCGSCWAIATTAALSDRMCIATQGRLDHTLSSDHLLTCCAACTGGDVCEGGNPMRAWYYMLENGVPTGGDYGSCQGCKPYRIPPCSYPGYPPCADLTKPSIPLECTGEHCSNPYFRTPYDDNLFFVDFAFTLNVHRRKGMNISTWAQLQGNLMQLEIFHFGSIVAAIEAHQDLIIYKKGVYQHTVGEMSGGHAVKIIGWGVEDGVKYWLCVNSWGELWGDGGLFKIRRGTDESRIESFQVSAGRVDIHRSSDLEEFEYDTNTTTESSSDVPNTQFSTPIPDAHSSSPIPTTECTSDFPVESSSVRLNGLSAVVCLTILMGIVYSIC
ncbi:hypothetical protein M8J77_023651 [Diaphorina citri]|nr:hypothetical protein M8J77_023651 [Diaphorina citri]